jgi:hypothetical protein
LAGEIGLGGRFVFERGHLVGVNADDEITDVIVDACKPVSDSSGDDDYVAWLEVVGDAVSDGNSVAAFSARDTSDPRPRPGQPSPPPDPNKKIVQGYYAFTLPGK